MTLLISMLLLASPISPTEAGALFQQSITLEVNGMIPLINKFLAQNPRGENSYSFFRRGMRNSEFFDEAASQVVKKIESKGWNVIFEGPGGCSEGRCWWVSYRFYPATMLLPLRIEN